MKRTLTIVLSLACICVPLLEPSTQAINSLVIAQTISSNNKSDTEINSIAQKITVQIFEAVSQQEENFIGTGFIVKKQSKQGNNFDYQVLTNAHVVKKLHTGYQYQIKTYENRIYKAFLPKNANKFQNYDLAILTFSSSVGYETAKLGKSDRLQPQNKIFVAGFPCESIQCKPKLTIKSGVIAPIEFLLQGKTLVNGYRIGYDIDVQSGTSGGPIIDTVGEVVGVNGRSKFVGSPFANAPDPYRFDDNTQPEKDIKLLMGYFAWGIPIETYTKLDNINSPIEITPQSSLSGNTQRNSYTNSEAQGIVISNSLITNIILILILALIISIVWYSFKQWNKYKAETQQKSLPLKNKHEEQQSNLPLNFQAIEDKEKQQESNIYSERQQPKITDKKQKLSSGKAIFQKLFKPFYRIKNHQKKKVQNLSPTKEQDK
ncbi:trypsin-like peptidase domain-containing protein [Desmonostoc muscorum LEGE 12446]|uniref:Trypsin-like peptidase domain-containing protein n=1 Tax=Desmonostoc muscorum LEGE 12446 TaxID=1828758 RepID=A0A8J6ZJM0_DESMC|nr:serine protease [Desmonostoc muscorum]MCF2150393.1 trypsin-like peptidase domain-containing protein [Desmonostoc muscorum LEGE 12446]